MNTQDTIKALWVTKGEQLEATTPHGSYRFSVVAVEDDGRVATLRLEEIK